jgi:hypothetical protein
MELTKVEQETLVDLQYLLDGHRKTIKATAIKGDKLWYKQRVAQIQAEIDARQKQLAELRNVHENAAEIIASEQARCQELLTLIKHRRHRLEIEQLLALHAKLNKAGLTPAQLDALRANVEAEDIT